MNRFTRWTQAAATVAISTTTFLPTPAAQAASLGIGDHAPPIKVKAFVKGTPVRKLPRGKVSVVEFWATWCGPCKASIPHLTEMAKKYPQVTFVGVSVRERNQAYVVPFVKLMGNQMDYHIAMDRVPAGDRDGMSGAMVKTWMKAAGQTAIPLAFVVGPDGKIDWIGWPMDMEKPLAKITAGKWDRVVAAAQRKKDQEQEAQMDALYTEMQTAMATKDPEKIKKAIVVLDAEVAQNPSSESDLGALKYGMLRATDTPEKAQTYLKHLITGIYKSDANELNAVAYPIVDPDTNTKADPPTRALALQAAQQADSLLQGKDGNVADTLAAACFANGDSAGAVKAETRAIALTDPASGSIAGMKKGLARYQADATKK